MLVPIFAFLLLQKPDLQADGLKALQEQRYADAVQIFNKAIAADPNDYGAHFNLGLAYTFLTKDAEAIAEYRKVLELKPGLYQAELNIGQVLLRDKQAAEALPHLEAAAKGKPDQYRPQFYAGEAALAAGELDKAETYYSAASKADPKSAQVEAGLAQLAMKRDRLDDAETHFAKAAELDPRYKDTILQLAEAYEQKKNLAKAADIYKLFPDNPAARERLGSIFLQTGQAARAIPDLEEAVRKSPSSANQYALAMAYVKNKEAAKAEPLLAQATQAEPQNTDLRMSYARVLRDEKKYPAAAQEFYKVAQLKPDSSDAWSELAGVLVILQKDPEALVALDKIHALGAEKPGHYFIRAIVLDRNKVYDGALENYEKFLAADAGESPDEEFKARQRVRIIRKEQSRR